MQSWQVLIPPVVVLLLSFITKKVNQALLAGIVTGAFIVSGYDPIQTIVLTAQRIFAQAKDLDNLYLYGFIFMLGAVVILMIHSGSTAAYGKAIKRLVSTKRSAQVASLSLSTLFFIDDYLSSLTVGSVMKGITDQYKVPRVKLSFLINMFAPSLAIAVPLSSWIAMILSQLKNAGISDVASDNPLIQADPFMVYVQAVPYTFYSIIIFLATWFIVFAGISFGPMREHESIATKTDNLFGGKKPLKTITPDSHARATLFDFIIPVLVTFLSVPVAILYSGNFYLFGGDRGLLDSITQSNIFSALFYGSIIAFALIASFYLIRRKITFSTLVVTAKDTFDLIQASIILLLLAATFSAFIRFDLPAGAYIANLVVGSLQLWLLPFIFFVISAITSLATGSAWGTIAVMSPLAIQILLSMLHVTTPISAEDVPFLFPVIGAVFSGAVAGTHITPIADNAMISTTSAGSYLIDHVKAQTHYVLPSIIATGVAFLIVGLLSNWPAYSALSVGLLVGIGISLSGLKILHGRY